MQDYRLITNSYTVEIAEYAVRISDGALVHRSLDQEYLKWLAAGNQPIPANAGEGNEPMPAETPDAD